MCDTRAVFDVRTGALTTRERIEHALGMRAAALFATDEIAPILREREPSDMHINTLPPGEEFLFINGALVMLPDEVLHLETGEGVVDNKSHQTCAGRAGEEMALAVRLGAQDAAAFIDSLNAPKSVKMKGCSGALVLRNAWDVIRHRDAAIAHDLAALVVSRKAQCLRAPPHGVHVLGDFAVIVDPEAHVSPIVVLDASKGAIVLDRGAIVRPGVVIHGPAYIGAASHALERTLIKPNTAIGPMCKVAGEVGGTIIQSFSNKAHDGHLGDAWLGEWVNLGASTINSNLLNTYGTIASPVGPDTPSKRRTGMTFLGCIIGDHTKTAIGTRIMTGTTIGVGAMIAASAPPPQATPTFAWLTDAGSHVHRLDRFLESAARMMDRRDVAMSPAMERRLRDLHKCAAAVRPSGSS